MDKIIYFFAIYALIHLLSCTSTEKIIISRDLSGSSIYNGINLDLQSFQDGSNDINYPQVVKYYFHSIDILNESYQRYRPTCSGVFIGSQHLLTAAHCLSNRDPGTEIGILSNRLEIRANPKKAKANYQTFKVDHVSIHPFHGTNGLEIYKRIQNLHPSLSFLAPDKEQYYQNERDRYPHSLYFNYDFAIIKLQKDYSGLKQFMPPMEYIYGDKLTQEDIQKAIFMGYGETLDNQKNLTNQLHACFDTDLPYRNKLNNIITINFDDSQQEDHFRRLEKRSYSKSQCGLRAGDSGGPLIVVNKNGDHQVIGINQGHGSYAPSKEMSLTMVRTNSFAIIEDSFEKLNTPEARFTQLLKQDHDKIAQRFLEHITDQYGSESSIELSHQMIMMQNKTLALLVKATIDGKQFYGIMSVEDASLIRLLPI